MGVRVYTNQHGYLFFRIFWKGRDVAVGAKYKDDGRRGRNRRLLEAKATLIEEEIRAGQPIHEALITVLGDCPARLVPSELRPSRQPVSALTVEAFADWWLEKLAARRERKSLVRKTRVYMQAVILPFWGKTPLERVTPQRVLAFQECVLDRRKRDGRPIVVKTAKNIVSGHFKAMINAARRIHGVPIRDPFDVLEWPDEVAWQEPDPFTPGERDRILAYFREHRPRWYPWLFTLFWTGMRQGESIALRIADLDLTRGILRIERSRTEGEENAPKTRGSTRTVHLLPNVIEVLGEHVAGVRRHPRRYLFLNLNGEPINSTEWPKRSFYPVLRRLKIRSRKFYTTRHTFISAMLTEGANPAWIAQYCGTSLGMIQRSYGRYVAKGGLDPAALNAVLRTGEAVRPIEHRAEGQVGEAHPIEASPALHRRR